MALQRLLLLLLYLQGRGLVTVSELASFLEVSRRTVYRDIDALRTVGADIIGISGPGGGFRLSTSFRLEKLAFSDAEWMAIRLATTVLSEFKGTEFAEQAAEFSGKIERLLGRRANGRGNLTDMVLIDAEDRFPKADRRNDLRLCEKALLEGLAVQITYDSPLCKELSTTSVVDPYGIVNKAGSWFLVGYCHELETYRAFNTVYVRQMRLTGRRFARDSAFNLKSFWETVKPR